MTTTQRVLLAVVAGALFGAGAWLLRDDPAAPPPPPRTDPAEPPAATTAPAPTPPTALTPPPARVDGGTSPSEAPAAPATSPTVELAPSPFADGSSEELQYAVKLVTGPDTGPVQWRKAAEVFQRCIDANPTNHLCRRGVYAAWERIDSDGGAPTALTPPVVFQPGERPRELDEVLRNTNLAPKAR